MRPNGDLIKRFKATTWSAAVEAEKQTINGSMAEVLVLLQVRPNGDIINAFQGDNEEVQRVLLGNIKDLRAVNAERLGGVPIERLQAGLEQQKRIAGAPDSKRQFRRKIMGFSDNRPVPLPPNAPAQITKVGVEVYVVISLGMKCQCILCLGYHQLVNCDERRHRLHALATYVTDRTLLALRCVYTVDC